jgi:two-component system response regulator YesN
MYKVFFVDDEAAMRAGLRDSISWERSDFTLVGEAPDGELALSLISETLPDILITDVKMPFMDGLELSRRVTRTMPWVKIVILSGHDEFEYAKQAIKIGVSEYLLKPVTSETLFQALESIAREIEAERERRRTIEGLRKEVSDARRFQIERTLSNLVYGLSAEKIPSGMEPLNSFAASPRFLTVLMEISPAAPEDLETVVKGQKSLFEILSSNENIKSFPEGAERAVCVFAAGDDDSLEEDAYATAQAVKYEIERRHPCAVSIAIGSPAGRVADLPKSFSHAKRAMRHMERLGRRMILGFRDMEPGPRQERKKEEGKKPQTHYLKSSRYSDVIEKSTEYIREHFAEGNVSLNTVAEFVGLSPNHFSTVFSQETGETFIECLTRARLQHAKELLRRTAIRSSEIAYKVGYNDPHYFSYVFKKNIGLSPSEYRNRIE